MFPKDASLAAGEAGKLRSDTEGMGKEWGDRRELVLSGWLHEAHGHTDSHGPRCHWQGLMIKADHKCHTGNILCY